jgi:hypothetical protein
MNIRVLSVLICICPVLLSCNGDKISITSGSQTGSSSFSLTAPTIALDASTTSPSVFSTPPTFLISHVSSGDTVEIFSDSSCATLVGSGVATGSTISIQSSALATGSYEFATKRSNSSGSSPCSTEGVEVQAKLGIHQKL